MLDKVFDAIRRTFEEGESPMIRPTCKLLLIGAVATAVLAGGAMKADAFWGWGCCRPVAYSCYSYSVPVYTATYCYDPCGYTTCSYYLGWRRGPVRRLLFGRYRWYYGCWTTPAVTYDVFDGPVVAPRMAPTVEPEPRPADPPFDPMPAEPVPPDPPPAILEPAIPQPAIPEPAIIPQPQEFPLPAEPAPGLIPGEAAPFLPPAAAPGFDFDPLEPARPGTSYVPKPSNSGLISVWVPHDARVIVNGYVTESKGSRRQFVSYGMQPGYSYKYEIKAQVIRDGKIIEDVRTVTLTAGQDTSVAFGFQSLPSQSLASQW